MHVAILTFEGYNELDSLIAFGILNRIEEPGWRVWRTSMHGSDDQALG